MIDIEAVPIDEPDDRAGGEPRVRDHAARRIPGERPEPGEGRAGGLLGLLCGLGVETDADAVDRHELLRAIGYKL